MPHPIEEMVNAHLGQFNVVVKFLDPVFNYDLPNYNRGQITEIIAAILKRFENNGNSHQATNEWVLKDDLLGYFKIRLLPQMIRIVYRIEELPNQTAATIIVVGPKQDEKAYKIAKKRIGRFY